MGYFSLDHSIIIIFVPCTPIYSIWKICCCYWNISSANFWRLVSFYFAHKLFKIWRVISRRIRLSFSITLTGWTICVICFFARLRQFPFEKIQYINHWNRATHSSRIFPKLPNSWILQYLKLSTCKIYWEIKLKRNRQAHRINNDDKKIRDSLQWFIHNFGWFPFTNKWR